MTIKSQKTGRNFCHKFACGIALLFASNAYAQTITVNVADLGSAIASSQSEPNAVQRLLLENIQERIDELDLQLNGDELLFSDELTNQTVEDGCTNTVIRQMTTQVALAGDTGISLTLESLFDPVELSLNLAADVNARGRAQQVFGFRLGNCVEVASDSFDFSAVGPLAMTLDLSLTLNPVWVNDSTLQINPVISVDGELLQSNISADVDDSILRALIERFLQSEIDDLFNPARLRETLADVQVSLNEQLATDADAIELELPPATDEQIVALYELLTPEARFPLSADFLRANRLDILAALIFDDQNRITEILENAALCEITENLAIDLPRSSVYQLNNGVCEVAGVDQAATLYGDSSCAIPFDFFPTTFSEFCGVALDSNQLGNAAANSFELQRWSLSPGSRFEIGVESIEGKQQPFVQRRNYKNAIAANGNCALEMRVYKDNPASTNQKTMIALHGGSWQNRGTGFFGIENMATHFVNEGFVVFSPFYRLVHDSDGSEECHNATFEELLSDVEDAFTWVQQNAASYGANGRPLVFGQSAGGHLAAYLAVQQPEQVERAVLFYAPTDFEDFARQIQSGEYVNDAGIRIMERVTGESLETLDLQSSVVVNNTFPDIVMAEPDRYPPMFMLHGESDSLLPFRQSVRMCNGLWGDVENGPAPFDMNTETTRQTFLCDNRGSQLHLVAQGEHTLDLCISEELCLAGSPASAEATADSLQLMLDWSAADSLAAFGPSNDRPMGGGRVDWFILLLLLPAAINRRLRVLPRY